MLGEDIEAASTDLATLEKYIHRAGDGPGWCIMPAADLPPRALKAFAEIATRRDLETELLAA
jgi:hypothetical protein